jgi:hypothetical protein
LNIQHNQAENGILRYQVDSKTVEELSVEITDGCKQCNIDPCDPSILFVTTVKDGGDGLGDVFVYKEKSDRALPDKINWF